MGSPPDHNVRVAFFNGVGYTPSKREFTASELTQAWRRIQAAERGAVAVKVWHGDKLLQAVEKQGLYPGAVPTPWDQREASVRNAKGEAAPPASKDDFGDDVDARDHYVASIRRNFNAAVADDMTLRRRMAHLRQEEERATGLAFGEYTAVGDEVLVPAPLDPESLERIADAFADPVAEA